MWVLEGLACHLSVWVEEETGPLLLAWVLEGLACHLSVWVGEGVCPLLLAWVLEWLACLLSEWVEEGWALLPWRGCWSGLPASSRSG